MQKVIVTEEKIYTQEINSEGGGGGGDGGQQVAAVSPTVNIDHERKPPDETVVSADSKTKVPSLPSSN